MKGGEYSLKEISKGQVESSWGSSLLHPPTLQRDFFFTVFGPHQSSHGLGRCDFYYANNGGGDFFCGNGFGGEVWVSFSSVLELAYLGQSVFSNLTPHPTGKASMEFVEYKQASSQM